MRVCVYLLHHPSPQRFKAFCPAVKRKSGEGRPSRGGGKEATTTWTATTTTTTAGREIVSWCRVYVGRFYRERVTRLYEWLYTFVTASSKHREKGIYFFFSLIFDSKWKREPFRGCCFFFFFFFKREVRVERLKGGSWKKFLPKNFLTMRIIRSSSLSFFFCFPFRCGTIGEEGFGFSSRFHLFFEGKEKSSITLNFKFLSRLKLGGIEQVRNHSHRGR